ncbi:MAG TPA: hypothetical protein VFV15_02335 [Moraxellaceae bacterium]|nr:hypothetical protein [Moraxellaceae bacterium]
MLKRAALFLGLSLLLPLAHAEDARWFRYYDDKKQPVVTDSVTSEHMSRGYDELTASMRLIRHVEPQRALSAEEQAALRAKRDADIQRAKDDKQLLRLYAGPADAERARNRQLDALQVRIDFSNNMLTTLRQRRAAEAQRAATSERTGKPVPADVKTAIANFDKQITAAQAEVDARKAEQEKVKGDFEPVIKRLAELTGKPASATPWAPTPTPGTGSAKP